MFRDIDDLRIKSIRPVVPPALLLEELPVNEEVSEHIANSRDEIANVIKGEDDRLMVVIGPCSIHDTKAAREYADKLKEAADKYRDELLIIMRVYFEKPRTTVGWKGLINDPDIDESHNINKGLRKARGLLLYLAEIGLPSGTEFLDVITPQFIADVCCWGAIGARTTESQVHRQLASGLSVPVGFKNGTDGNIKIAVDALRSAAHSHTFLSVTKQGTSAIVETGGNPDCHIILRGSTQGPNYDADSIEETVEMLRQHDLHDAVMVDCSHGNSGKDHTVQPKVTANVAEQIRNGSKLISGVMLESHLVAGRQDYVEGEDTYGQSITDNCMGWDTSLDVLADFADAVKQRRKK
jgi:3-deoxy-7-phosphoheptulonate synthase